MTNRAPSVLSISYDESLLRTREWILQGAGFHVTSALGFIEASSLCREDRFDVVIIGHSLPQADKTALIQQVRTHNYTRILCLRRVGEGLLPGVDHSVEPSSGDVLLEAVRTALGSTEELVAAGQL